MGFAMDLGCDGVGIQKSYAEASKNRCFQWLQANAGKYGFFELGKGKPESRSGPGYEGWHWSVNGN
jgi:LAS superfamily LD-carboxypeptidase LdcB